MTNDLDLGVDVGYGMVLTRRCEGCGGDLFVDGLTLRNIRLKKWCSDRCAKATKQLLKKQRQGEARLVKAIARVTYDQLMGPRGVL